MPGDGDGPVFAEPWQAQAFALTVQLHRDGHFSWTEWAEELGAEIARAGGAGDPDDGRSYYQYWLAALERLVVRRGLASESALAKCKTDWRTAYESTPHGMPVALPGK